MTGQVPTQSLVTVPPKSTQGVQALPTQAQTAVSELLAQSKSAATVRAYKSDWLRWETWCREHGAIALPADPATVAWYLADQVTKTNVSSLRRHLATISKAHQVAGVESPTRSSLVRDALAGLRRAHSQPPKEAPGLLAADMRLTVSVMGDSERDLRDKALLLVGWYAALRRSELSRLTWADIEKDPDGLRLMLRHSKTDKTGEGQQVGLAKETDTQVCPVYALERWQQVLVSAGLYAPQAPVFPAINRYGRISHLALSGQAVAAVIAARTSEAGVSVKATGHSLRKGLVQQAHLAGVSDSAVMATTRHQSVTMLRRYQGTAALVTRSAGRGLIA